MPEVRIRSGTAPSVEYPARCAAATSRHRAARAVRRLQPARPPPRASPRGDRGARDVPIGERADEVDGAAARAALQRSPSTWRLRTSRGRDRCVPASRPARRSCRSRARLCRPRCCPCLRRRRPTACRARELGAHAGDPQAIERWAWPRSRPRLPRRRHRDRHHHHDENEALRWCCGACGRHLPRTYSRQMGRKESPRRRSRPTSGACCVCSRRSRPSRSSRAIRRSSHSRHLVAALL